MKKASDLRIPFTWADRRPIFLDRSIYIPGYYDKHEEWGKLDWRDEQVFGNDKPVIVEFCCGNGQWIGAKAKAHPEYNWIGVDKLFERARKVWAKIHREEIPNLFIACADAITFVRHYVQEGSVHEIYVNFPDPWPKLKHAKHRLIRKEFLDELSRAVKVGGRANFVTDDFVYASQMLSELSLCPQWKPLAPPPHYVTELPGFGESYFSNLWTEKGRTIYFLQYVNHGR
ncbi:MAG: tRNA (guanine(46)-N(7))-methyltransferase TrmB [Verrucomicrobia bacterium]|nr:tRNA (guanine(46)-N(7))-methyltransferase TrmB [Verrucomicrobiota bacterium]